MSEKTRYWYISYITKRHDSRHLRWEPAHDVSKVHPLEWLAECVEKWNEVESYIIVFYKETSKEMYDRLKGLIG